MVDGRGRLQRRQDVITTTTPLPSQIAATSFTAVVSGPIITASAPLTVTSLLGTNGVQTKTVPMSSGEQTSITSATHTDANSASKTSSNAPASSTAQASTDNLSTLIPAIVAPIAGILVISFVAFWLFMRRRQKKAVESEPEFVMEGVKEKPRTRPTTADSNSSTRELVPSKTKETAVNIREVERPGFNTNTMGKGTTFAPPRLDSAMGSRPGSRQADPTGRSKAIPNFSRGPRSMSRDTTSSPAPGFGNEERGGSRAGSRAGQHSSPFNEPGQRPANGSRGLERVNPPPPAAKQSQPRTGSFSRPLGFPIRVNRDQPSQPTHLNTRPDRPSQDGNTFHSTTGAYNGSSPISQYSPIIKELPKFGTTPNPIRANDKQRGPGGSISSMNDQGIRKPPPSAIKTSNSPLMPADPSFSEENVRIARLANNSRLGFHSMVATTAATSPATEEPPTPSPRLPPPATRDAPPTSYNIPLPAHEPPAPASIQARLNGASISDRRSVVSGLSDDYVDMEVDDNKSDVSSLDEREKWQMHTDTERAHSRQAGLGAYGGLGPRPPLISKDSHSSDASGSQYSLGYYTKDGEKGHDSK